MIGRPLVLAMRPFTRGLAFTLFEGPTSPIDWGVKGFRGRDSQQRILAAARELMFQHQPDVLVFECCLLARSRSARLLAESMQSHAEAQSIAVRSFHRTEIRNCFMAVTRREIAREIASRVNAFGHRVPPARQIWKSEDARMNLFDAAALAITFYHHSGGEDPRHGAEER